MTHLSPDRESLLPQILSRFTPMPVVPVAHGERIETDHVYVLAVGALVGIREGRFEVTTASEREPKPIDIFFSSLAANLGEAAVGIVMSGGDGDGTLGLKAIKEHGGLTLAQVDDAFGPRHPDMPDTAITSGFVDLPLPATEMGPRLVEFARSAQLMQDMVDASGPSVEAEIHEALPEIYAILRNQVGHDFSGYKKRTFVRCSGACRSGSWRAWPPTWSCCGSIPTKWACCSATS